MRDHQKEKAVFQLTYYLETNQSFSFLRLGDREIRYLIQNQTNTYDKHQDVLENKVSCEISKGSLGLQQKDYPRLLKSYEECHGLDLYAHQPYNEIWINKIKWRRNQDKWTLSKPDECGIINLWTLLEFKKYTSKHKSLIVGAEALLFKELSMEDEFRRIARNYLPDNNNLVFYEPPNRGRNISENYQKLRHDIKEIIKNEKCDTIFVSLGGVAKILCYEMAMESNIRAVDFGSMLRALTYSGSSGNSSNRASHNPFFFRIPLSLYIKCAKSAWPSLEISELLGKSHAQLCLELQRKKVAFSYTADANDPSVFDESKENMQSFAKSYKYYKKTIKPLAKNEGEYKIVKEFKYWILKKGIGWDGKIFKTLVQLKKAYRSFLNK